MGCVSSLSSTEGATTMCETCFVDLPVRKLVSPCFATGASCGHRVCFDCFHNQVRVWSDPVSGGSGVAAVTLAQEVADQVREEKNDDLHVTTKEMAAKLRRLLIPCAMPSCNAGFLPSTTRKFLGGNLPAMARYNQAVKRVIEKVQYASERARFKKTHDATKKKTHHLQGDLSPELSRDRSEREIFLEESLLTLRCPNCNLALLDYDGCNAVQCSGCLKYFCAWCLKFSGPSKECHGHVATCPENPQKGLVWSKKEEFERFHAAKKARRCVEFFRHERDSSLVERTHRVLDVSLGKESSDIIVRQLSFL